MPDDREDARKQYTKTRSEFEKLNAQDKTAFVVEATFTTIGQAIEETGRQFADVLERVASYDFGSWREPGSERDAPNPAAPPASASRASSPPRRRKSVDEDEIEDE